MVHFVGLYFIMKISVLVISLKKIPETYRFSCKMFKPSSIMICVGPPSKLI